MVQTGKRQYYVFNRLVNAYHAAVLSRSASAPKIIDYITEVAQKNNAISTELFYNHRASSDIMKLAVKH